MKNVGTGVMLVAAILIAIVLVVLPSDQVIPDNEPVNILNPPSDYEKAILNQADEPENFFNQLMVNSYSINVVQTNSQQLRKQNRTPNSPVINKIITLFDIYVEKLFKNYLIPGAAVVVVYKDRIVYMKTLGVKKVGESDPINWDTIFEIGSCTKAFTATAISSLVEEGKMTWDDLAKLYYPNPADFDLYDPLVANKINMRDLLSHRSGLPQHAGTFHVLDFWYDFDETLYRMRFLKPESEFRTKFAYQNILLSMAGYASGKAVGTSWDDVMKQEIFNPLMMDSSVTTLQDFLKNPNHASNHYIINGKAYYVDPINLDSMGPAATISSSIKDLGNWLLFQVNRGKFNGQQIISYPFLAETYKPHTMIKQEPNYNGAYGLGWGIEWGPGMRVISHSGSTRYSTSNTFLFPLYDLGIIVVANEGSKGNEFGNLLGRALYQLYKKNALTGKQAPSNTLTSIIHDDGFTEPEYDKLPDKIVSADPLPHPIENYAGNYYSDYWGNLKITKKDDNSLLAYTGKNPNPTLLKHWTGNTFKDEYYLTEVKFNDFVGNKPQKLDGKRWEIYGANGTFTRV